MKRILCVAMLLLLVSVMGNAQDKKDKNMAGGGATDQALIDKEKSLWEAWKNHDMKPFNEMTASKGAFIGNSGVADSAAALKELADHPCEVRSYAIEDAKVTWLDKDAAIVTYKATQDATCGSETPPKAIWASSVWIKEGGKWKSASHQETPAKEAMAETKTP